MIKIHKEGAASLFLAVATAMFLTLGAKALYPESKAIFFSAAFMGLFLFLFMLQFFRNPDRSVVVNTEHIIAPADGKVVVTEITEEGEYFKDKRLQVSIFMSPVNVHVNRSPVTGTVSYYKYHPGKYLMAWEPKSSTDNERTTVAVKTESGTEVLFRQIAGFLARRIVCYVKTGDQVEQGKEFGFIKFGSRVDVFLPLTARLKVSPGQTVRGGETVIAELI